NRGATRGPAARIICVPRIERFASEQWLRCTCKPKFRCRRFANRVETGSQHRGNELGIGVSHCRPHGESAATGEGRCALEIEQILNERWYAREETIEALSF